MFRSVVCSIFKMSFGSIYSPWKKCSSFGVKILSDISLYTLVSLNSSISTLLIRLKILLFLNNTTQEKAGSDQSKRQGPGGAASARSARSDATHDRGPPLAANALEIDMKRLSTLALLTLLSLCLAGCLRRRKHCRPHVPVAGGVCPECILTARKTALKADLL